MTASELYARLRRAGVRRAGVLRWEAWRQVREVFATR